MLIMGTVSELERGQGNPTIETLFALAYALDATLADLVDAPLNAEVRVVRAVERPFIVGRPLDALAYCIAANSSGWCWRVYELLIHPGATQQAQAHRPGVEEHVYVVDGDLTVGPQDQPISLGARNYADYSADMAHVYSSRDGARALLTMTMPPRY
jgi:transcriptional regulator with XRE-family HTH domain